MRPGTAIRRPPGATSAFWPTSQDLAPPVLGRSVNADPVSGRVLVAVPAARPIQRVRAGPEGPDVRTPE